MASSGGGSQLDLVTRCTNLFPFTFPSVSFEVVKHSFQWQSFNKAARGGLGTRLWSWISISSKLAVISTGNERDSIEL